MTLLLSAARHSKIVPARRLRIGRAEHQQRGPDREYRPYEAVSKDHRDRYLELEQDLVADLHVDLGPAGHFNRDGESIVTTGPRTPAHRLASPNPFSAESGAERWGHRTSPISGSPERRCTRELPSDSLFDGFPMVVAIPALSSASCPNAAILSLTVDRRDARFGPTRHQARAMRTSR